MAIKHTILLHTLLLRFSQMLDPLHCLHPLLWWLFSQMLDQSHCLQLLFFAVVLAHASSLHCLHCLSMRVPTCLTPHIANIRQWAFCAVVRAPCALFLENFSPYPPSPTPFPHNCYFALPSASDFLFSTDPSSSCLQNHRACVWLLSLSCF